MAYLGSEKIKELITEKGIIHPKPDTEEIVKRVKHGAYELSLGNQIFQTDSEDKKRSATPETVTINPGQFALLLTKESIRIPQDKIAFISIKAGIKLRGLINVSGFHVDPGFEGKLVFSVYNAGSGPISLEKDAPCFLIWFANLDVQNGDQDSYNGEHQDQDSIPLKYIDSLNSSELASPNVLMKKINDNYKDLDAKATTRSYIYRTGFGILIVAVLKILLDWGAYERGRFDGKNSSIEQMHADSILNELLVQKRTLLIQIDSLEEKRWTVESQNRKGDGKK